MPKVLCGYKKLCGNWHRCNHGTIRHRCNRGTAKGRGKKREVEMANAYIIG